jgi:hypothetical protein
VLVQVPVTHGLPADNMYYSFGQELLTRIYAEPTEPIGRCINRLAREFRLGAHDRIAPSDRASGTALRGSRGSNLQSACLMNHGRCLLFALNRL